MTRRVYIGHRSLDRLKRTLEMMGRPGVFLVTGRRSFDTCGAGAAMQSVLHGCRVHRFCDFGTHLVWADVVRGVDRLRATPADVVIGVGGGSVLDMAKLVAVLHAQPGDPVDYVCGDRALTGTRKPLMAVPTTAGSGSEATHFAVVYVDGDKRGPADPMLRPDIAVIAPELTYSLPARVTALCGVDAFAQAIESYWSVRATDASKAYCRKALRLIKRHLVKAVTAPTPTARSAMARAAHLAGRAIDVTTTTACHALSYTMTADWGVPHGQAVAVTLAEMYAFNGRVTEDDVADVRGVDYVAATMADLNAVLGCRDVVAAREIIRTLVRSIGLETRLSALGIEGDDALARIVEGVNPERLANNPRRVSRTSIHELLSATEDAANAVVAIGSAPEDPESWKTSRCPA